MGDCGAWLVGAAGDSTHLLYGYKVASKEGTEIAYTILMRDVFRDIRLQLNKSDIRIPSEKELASSRGDLIQSHGGKENDLWQESCVHSLGKLLWINKFTSTNYTNRCRRCEIFIVSLHSEEFDERYRAIEREMDPVAMTSFDPLPIPIAGKSSQDDMHIRDYLPCHW